MRNKLIPSLRIIIPIAVIGWLLTTIDPAQAAELRDRSKDWNLLLTGIGLATTAVCLSFVRWYLLVRIAGLSLTFSDAFRLSCVGYLANFVSMGNVGGDLFKAVFVSREQPQQRTTAVATVIVDRVIGLYALLLLASLTLLVGYVSPRTHVLKMVSEFTVAVTGLGGIAVMLVFVPGFTHGHVSKWLASLPRIGKVLERLLVSMRLYRGHPGTLTLMIGISIVVHGLLALSVYLLSIGLFGSGPSIAEHLVIVPLSCIAGAVPLTPAGLGSFEVAMQELYRHVPVGGPVVVSGILVALAYRLVTIAIAVCGVVYYWIFSPAFKQAQDPVPGVSA